MAEGSALAESVPDPAQWECAGCSERAQRERMKQRAGNRYDSVEFFLLEGLTDAEIAQLRSPPVEG